DAPLHGFEPIADEGEGAIEHHVHRVVEVGAFGVVLEGNLFVVVLQVHRWVREIGPPPGAAQPAIVPDPGGLDTLVSVHPGAGHSQQYPQRGRHPAQMSRGMDAPPFVGWTRAARPASRSRRWQRRRPTFGRPAYATATGTPRKCGEEWTSRL